MGTDSVFRVGGHISPSCSTFQLTLIPIRIPKELFLELGKIIVTHLEKLTGRIRERSFWYLSTLS